MRSLIWRHKHTSTRYKRLCVCWLSGNVSNLCCFGSRCAFQKFLTILQAYALRYTTTTLVSVRLFRHPPLMFLCSCYFDLAAAVNDAWSDTEAKRGGTSSRQHFCGFMVMIHMNLLLSLRLLWLYILHRVRSDALRLICHWAQRGHGVLTSEPALDYFV